HAFLTRHPNDVLVPRAKIWLSRSYVSLERFDTARQILRAVSRQKQGERDGALAEVYLVYVARLTNDTHSYRSDIRKFIKTHPTFHMVEGMGPHEDVALIASLLADTRMRNGEFRAALEDLEV